MAYTGSVDLISGIRPKNNGTFPLVDAKDVRVDDNTRLDEALSDVNSDLDATVRVDIAQTFTAAQKAQGRNNIDTPAVTSVAPAYSASSTYNVGDYVTYNGELYKCRVVIDTAEDWTSNHWRKSSVNSEITDLNDRINYNEWGFRRNFITINNTEFESGRWSGRKKVASDYHWRLSKLIPITKGTTIVVSPSISEKILCIGYYLAESYTASNYTEYSLADDNDTIILAADTGLLVVQCTIDNATSFEQNEIDFFITLYSNQFTNSKLAGYLSISQDNSDLNDYIIPGTYFLHRSIVCDNKPPMEGTLVLTVKSILYSSDSEQGMFVNQYAEYGYSNTHRELIYKRGYRADVGLWSDWEMIASSEDTSNYYLLSRGDITENSISLNSNLDDYKNIGIYYLSTQNASTVLNLPELSAGKLIVECPANNSSFRLQTFYSYSSALNRIYRRSFNSDLNTWSEWIKLINNNDIQYLYTTIKTVNANDGYISGSYSSGKIINNITAYCAQVVHMNKGDRICIDVGENLTLQVFGYSTYPTNSTSSWIKTYSNVKSGLKIVHDIPEESFAGVCLIYSERPAVENVNTVIRFERFVGNIAVIEAKKNTKNIELENYNVIEIKDFVNGSAYSGGIRTDPNEDSIFYYRATMQDAIGIPQDGDFIVRINDGYTVEFLSGVSVRNLTTNKHWFTDGDIYECPKGHMYFRASIAKNTTVLDTKSVDTITPEEAASAGLKLYYKPKEGVTNFSEKQISLINSSRAKLVGSRFSQNELPTIAHTSDCHGDYERVRRFISLCENEGIDCGCITGDIVSYNPSHNINWFHQLINDSGARIAICTGNHDVYDDNMTDNDIYDFLFAPIATKLQMAEEDGKTWYYTDVANKSIRIISFNLYQYGGSSRWYTHLTEEQVDWFIDTLNSTPSGYGILILAHAPQVTLNKDQAYATFYQTDRLYNGTHNSVSGGVPIYDIIDAFISRSSINKTYTQTGNPSSFTVTADFTNIDSSIEFIAHLTGHFHQDTICYIPNTTQKQLMLNVTCTNALYGYDGGYPYLADICDVPRNRNDHTQDAFNIYSIDRTNKLVKVIRIGSNRTSNNVERQYMEIPYAD